MLQHVLVLGVKAGAPLANLLRAVCDRQRVHPLFIGDWTEWRVSVMPNEGDYRIRSTKTGEQSSRSTTAGVLYFDHPALPLVDSEDAAYQAVEYDALLFGLCLLASPLFASRWSFIAAGESDVTQRLNPTGKSLIPYGLLERMIAMGSYEAVAFADECFTCSPQGEISHLAEWGHLPCHMPVLLELDTSTRTYNVFVGRLPEWVVRCEGLLAKIFHAEQSAPLPSFTPTPLAPVNAGNEREFAIIAHLRDTTAVHLVHQARLLGVHPTFFDLTYLYSTTCSSTLFEETLTQVAQVPFLFARALLGVPRPDTLDLAIERHLEIVRALEHRSNTTVNRPSAGHTNISKLAHLSTLRDYGLVVPTTLVTNDPDAALEFHQAHSPIVFKSVSNTRSVTTILRSGDLSRVQLLPHCPVLFQRFVDGKNCRVHTVGTKPIGVVISSTATDYRFTQTAEFSLLDLDRTILSRLVSAATTSGLLLSGCDLKWCTVQGAWNVLEINRMPAFEYYDHRTEANVATEILKYASSR